MKNVSKLALFACVLTASITITSCSNDDDAPTQQELSLYQKLGGTAMVSDPNNTGQMIEQGWLTVPLL
jgi:hypothetical protein